VGLVILWWAWQRQDLSDQSELSSGASVAETEDGTSADPRVDHSTDPTWTGVHPRPIGAGPEAIPLPEMGAQTVKVSGRVSDRIHDTPAPFVDVIFASHGAESTATTDESGQYSLVLAPGTYQVRAVGDRVMAIGLPAFVLGRSERSYDITVVEHAVIRGHVTREDGSSAAGAIVAPQVQGTAEGSSARGELGSAEVQSDGSFELFTLPGTLVLHATSAAVSGSVAVPKIESGEEREGVEITMVANGFIAGKVVTPSGAPIGDAKVLASMRIPGSGEYDRIPIATDSKGRFSYQVLRPVHTIVEASARGFAQSEPIAFTLAAGESRKDLTLVLVEANLTLAGRVVDSAGEPLDYVEVAQGQVGSKERYKKVMTNSDGEFVITELGPGPHRLRARKSGYEQTRLQDVKAPASNLRIVMPLSGSGASASN
jgi:hypothetical protein